MATHPRALDWPAGALLPEPGLVKQWAWRALSAAREEIHLAVESVMEDLEGLSAGCSAMTDSAHERDAGPSGIYFDDDELPSRNGVDGEEDVLRVDDLIAPVLTRPEHEQEMPETPTTCRADDDFEIIDFEAEVGIRGF